MTMRPLLLPILALSSAATGRPECPTIINTTVPDGSWENRSSQSVFTSMASIHEALLRCPDIKTLKVRAALLGCSEWPDRFNLPLALEGGERYRSAPEILSLDGYYTDETEWEECETLGSALARFWDGNLSNVCSPELLWKCLRYYLLVPKHKRTKTNLDLWLDAMDFSRIHTLHLNNTSGRYVLTEQALAKLPPKLPSLESLKVHNAIGGRFILALPKNTLRHIIWQNPSIDDQHNITTADALNRLLTHHGTSIHSLEYRTDESEYSATPALTADQLQNLTNLAPNLRTLTLHLAREPGEPDALASHSTNPAPDWPWAALRTLARGLPNLIDLTVYLDLASACHRQRRRRPGSVPHDSACAGAEVRVGTGSQAAAALSALAEEYEDSYATPMLNRTSAAQMARFLARNKVGEALRRVTFRAGDWTAPWDGPLSWPLWMEGQRVWVSCVPRDKDGVEGREEGGGEGESGFVCDGEESLKHEKWHPAYLSLSWARPLEQVPSGVEEGDL